MTLRHMGLVKDHFKQLASPPVVPAMLHIGKTSSKLLKQLYKYTYVGVHLHCQMILQIVCCQCHIYIPVLCSNVSEISCEGSIRYPGRHLVAEKENLELSEFVKC